MLKFKRKKKADYEIEGIIPSRCDVYSHGVLLVERKKPTDDMFMGVVIRSQINTPRPQCWTRNTQDSQTLI